MKHLGVVIPACNEEQYIEACIEALTKATQYHQSLSLSQDSISFKIEILVVLDHCTDKTQTILERLDINFLVCDFQCVGKTRDLGIQHLISQGFDWICCTDADSTVSENWFETMREYQTHAIDIMCGVVEVSSWAHLSQTTQHEYLSHYQDCMNHRHIHGANLCFKSKVYQALGGFQALTCHEDVEFIQRAEAHHFNILWTNQLRVKTSSRLQSRVTHGFAHFLENLESKRLLS